MRSGSRESKLSPARRAAYDALILPPYGDPGEDDTFRLPAVFRDLDMKDRALAQKIYRGVMQNLRLLDVILASSGTFKPAKTPMKLRWVLRMAVYQRIFLSSIPDYAIVQQAVEHARSVSGEKAARFMNGVMRNLMQKLPQDETQIEPLLEQADDTKLETRYSVPSEVARVLGEAYGESRLEGILQAGNRDESAVWIRVNRLKVDTETLRSHLESEGVDTGAPMASGTALLWTGGAKPWTTRAWERGELTIQDLGAMLAAWILRPDPDEIVTDWCAAPGGKAGQLWELMQGRGTLYAYEPNPQRREVLRQTMERLHGEDGRLPEGLKILDIVRANKEGELIPPPANAMLVDAPCLALGLIGRHPEVRWDNRLAQLPRISRIQTWILDAAGDHVAPGGRMLWVTCSPTRAEIEERLGTWLERNPHFSPMEIECRVPEWAQSWVMSRGHVLRTLPDQERVDGFGMALLQRKN